MAGVTTNYALRFQDVGDSPNGAVGIQNLANDIDAALAVVDAKIATLNSFDTTFTSSTTDEVGFTSTSFIAGGAPVGVAFTAPPSGKVKIDFTGQIQQNINSFACILSCEVKTGSTVGSGTLAGGAANSDRALICGKAVVASGPSHMAATRAVFYSGLTPGASYNVRLMHCVDGGSGSIFNREIIIQPQL